MEHNFFTIGTYLLDLLHRATAPAQTENFRQEVAEYFNKITQNNSDEKVKREFQNALQHTLTIFFDELLLQSLKEGSNHSIATLKNVFQQTIWLTQHNYLQNLAVFYLLDSIFEVRTIRECEQLFELLEENTKPLSEIVLQIPEQYRGNSVKPMTALLKRLSKSNDTVFSGRILSFLAALLPLSDPSGLNKRGLINLSNITHIDENSALKEMEEIVTEGPIDFTFWRSFWTIQQYVQNPWAVFEHPTHWTQMTELMDRILKTLTATQIELADFPDDDDFSQQKTAHTTETLSSKVSNTTESRRQLELYHYDTYFTKFLTSLRLIRLEIQDPYFRRHILVQYLIYFQALKYATTFKPTYLLNESQKTTIKNFRAKTKELLERTPPNGKKVTEAILETLRREKNWMNWKKGGCKSFEKYPSLKRPIDEPTLDTEAKRRKIDEQTAVHIKSISEEHETGEIPEDFNKVNNIESRGEDSKAEENSESLEEVPTSRIVFDLGHPALNKLWNRTSQSGSSQPTLKEFLKPVVEGELSKIISNKMFEWRANRLLARNAFAQMTEVYSPRSSSRKLETVIQRVMSVTTLSTSSVNYQTNTASAPVSNSNNTNNDTEKQSQKENATKTTQALIQPKDEPQNTFEAPNVENRSLISTTSMAVNVDIGEASELTDVNMNDQTTSIDEVAANCEVATQPPTESKPTDEK
jgi:hypothetical protein